MEKTTLIISILGIFLLLLFLKIQPVNEISLSSINSQLIGKQVKVTGNIVSIKEYSNDFKVLIIKDKGESIQATCNCKNLSAYKNKSLEITGKVEQYKNSIQINIDKIVLKD